VPMGLMLDGDPQSQCIFQAEHKEVSVRCETPATTASRVRRWAHD
jgi:hypothetical protein